MVDWRTILVVRTPAAAIPRLEAVASSIAAGPLAKCRSTIDENSLMVLGRSSVERGAISPSASSSARSLWPAQWTTQIVGRNSDECC